MKKPQIFLSYAREDEEKVKELYQKLSDVEFKPWMDKKDILPGEKWGLVIQQAIRDSDFFLVCLSANSVSKRGWVQREMKQALDIWQEKLDSDIYLIPVRLEDCEAPESLRDFQWVNLFEEDGWTRLVKAIQVGMERQAKVIKPVVQEPAPFEPFTSIRPDTEAAKPTQMGRKQKQELVDALFACPTMSNRHTRDAVVNDLPDDIKRSVQRNSVDLVDAANIVTRCLNHANGIEELIEIVRFYEGDSIPMQRVDELVSQVHAS